MQNKAIEIVALVAAKSKSDVIECLMMGYTHPEDIARKLEVTRQAVDRTVRELFEAGVLDRSAIFPREGRPKIIYTISKEGRNLLRAIEEAGNHYQAELAGRKDAALRELDGRLAAGEMSEEIYIQKKADLSREGKQ
ncbi:MAG: winged helix-turn-helix transcriptional regulator [Euryarchaeota archaeon]|nr:winged helix-turn-helix transcriptional regulator [Euryarchaeota archaeon]